jgi:hypothetical protein
MGLDALMGLGGDYKMREGFDQSGLLFEMKLKMARFDLNILIVQCSSVLCLDLGDRP